MTEAKQEQETPPPMRGPEPKAKEVSAVATVDLGFKSVEGRSVLHQRFHVTREDGTTEPEWRPVPSLPTD